LSDEGPWQEPKWLGLETPTKSEQPAATAEPAPIPSGAEAPAPQEGTLPAAV
jgi:hypothetical protein